MKKYIPFLITAIILIADFSFNTNTTKAGADCEYAERRGFFGGCKGAIVQLCKGKVDCKLIPAQ